MRKNLWDVSTFTLYKKNETVIIKVQSDAGYNLTVSEMTYFKGQFMSLIEK